MTFSSTPTANTAGPDMKKYQTILEQTQKLSKDLESQIKSLEESYQKHQANVKDAMTKYPKPEEPKPPKPRYVFVDFGAANGDSLESFVEKKYAYAKPDNVDTTEAEVFLFEANPRHNEALLKWKVEYSTKYPKLKVNLFLHTAVYTIDTMLTFLASVNWGGSSLHDTHVQTVEGKATKVNVTAIDAARFLLMNFLPKDFVVVKMDIEGSEYDIIPRLVSTKAHLVMDHFYVEFHEFAFPAGTFNDKKKPVDDAIKVMKDAGINIPNYHTVT